MSLRWESNFHHVWDVLKNIDILCTPSKTKYITKEDKDYSEENKSLKMDIHNRIVQKDSKKINYLNKINFSFNFLRNTFIIVDMSENSILVDFKPNRMKYIFYKLKKFIKDYFTYNYISTITIIVTLNCTAEILSPFSNDPEKIIDNIDTKIFGIPKDNNNKKCYTPGGYFSLYNSLEAIKEIISGKLLENSKNDILIINNSLLTYDNIIKNELLLYFKDKFEINVISLEIPFEGLKELSINSGGTLLHINKENKNIHHYNTNGDIDEFLFYYSCKFSNINAVKIKKPIKFEDFDLNVDCPKYICFCHKKYQKIIYCCPECLDPYCYIPFYCTKCSFLNIDRTFLELLLRNKSDKENKDQNNNKCFPYKFSSYYNNYSKNNSYFLKNVDDVIKKLMIHEREFKRITEIKDLNNANYNNCSLGFKFKLVYFYIKFEKTRQNFYIDVKKNIFEDNYVDYVDKQKSIFLKDIVRCSGCNNTFEVKDEEDFDNIIIYSNCLDIFCIDCYKYLIDNNIGCLECTE